MDQSSTQSTASPYVEAEVAPECEQKHQAQNAADTWKWIRRAKPFLDAQARCVARVQFLQAAVHEFHALHPHDARESARALYRDGGVRATCGPPHDPMPRPRLPLPSLESEQEAHFQTFQVEE